MTTPTRERIVHFGAGDALAGILTLPHAPRAGVPHVVMVNAGIVHRVGPNRGYVDIARALGARGYPVLRFDLSGLGDSTAIAEGVSLGDAAVADIRAACDYLERSRQASGFLVAGLCSGANYSLLAAFADPRIAGLVLVDPTVARTRRGRIVHLARRIRHRATWWEIVTLRHAFWRRSMSRFRDGLPGHVEQESHGHRPTPTSRQTSEREVRANLGKLINRGAHLMLVFTGGVNHVYNYRNQLYDLLPGFDFRRQLRLEFMPHTDHAVSDMAGRAELLQSIGEWITSAFPGSASA